MIEADLLSAMLANLFNKSSRYNEIISWQGFYVRLVGGVDAASLFMRGLVFILSEAD